MKMNSCFLLLFFFFFLSVSAHQWEKFLNLTGCRLGDANPVIPDLKKYLHHFGYLSNEHHNPSKFTDSFDEDLHHALRTYQLNFNLKVTGVLDPPTIRLLMTPRCGVPDIINGTTSMLSGKLSGRLHYSFFQGNPIWPPSRRQLGYAIISSYPRIDIYTLRQVFANAFRRWEAVTDFRFYEVSPYNYPDITIGFYRGDHGDGYPFDGPLRTWAHAFAPTDGRFHLDADEDWSADLSWATSQYAVDLESVSIHEIGHLLGLDHSSYRDAIMYPTIAPLTRKVDLAYDDVLGISVLYGYRSQKEEEEESKLHVAY